MPTNSAHDIGRAIDKLKMLHDVLVDFMSANRTLSVLACKACLTFGPPDEHPNAIRRLIGLLPDAEWMLRDEIEELSGCSLRRRTRDRHRIYPADRADHWGKFSHKPNAMCSAASPVACSRVST